MLLALTPRKSRQRDSIRTLDLSDRPQLEVAFLQAFATAPEYADLDSEPFVHVGAEYYDRFFGHERGEWSPVSVLATHQRQIAGAVMVKKAGIEHLVDCLFVRPLYRHRGLATDMMDSVVDQLLAHGVTELRSYVMLANEPSLAWHRNYGFVEVPDYWVASQRRAFYHCELEDHEEMGDLPEAEVERLRQLTEYWWEEEERLKDQWSKEMLAQRQNVE